MYASSRQNSGSALLLLCALALTGASLATPARAQVPTDGRWMAWLGCWQQSDPGAPVAGGQVCILPKAGSAGVTFATLAGGKIVAEREVIADGRAHPITESGCRGSEVFEWSSDAHRLFRRADMTCTGGNRRSMTGVLAFLPDDRWVQIEGTGLTENLGVRVVHYGRWVAPSEIASRLPQGEDLAVQTARAVVSGPLRVSDVIEANDKVAPMVLQHLVFERRNGYELNTRTLETLAAAHVSANVIDLMVALTYPDRFHVEGAMAALSPRADTTRPGRGGYGGGGPAGWCFDNYGYSSYYRRAYLTSFGWWPYYGYGYGAYGYYPSSYYYDPCYGGGYGPWGGYWGGGGYYPGGIYYPNGGVIVIQPGNGNGAPNGGTYTGRTAHRRGDSGPPSSGSTGRSANPSSGSSGGSSSGSSGSSGGSSAGGSSGGSSSGGGGRTAHPR